MDLGDLNSCVGLTQRDPPHLKVPFRKTLFDQNQNHAYAQYGNYRIYLIIPSNIDPLVSKIHF